MDDLCELCNENIATTGVRNVILCQDCFEKIQKGTDIAVFSKFKQLAESRRELKVSGTFFDELCLMMTGLDRGPRVP